MKNIKKLLSLVLAGALLFTLPPRRRMTRNTPNAAYVSIPVISPWYRARLK